MTASGEGARWWGPPGHLESDAACSWPLTAPLDIARTLIGGHGPRERPTTLLRPDGAWRAMVHESGPVTLRLRREEGRLVAHAWGPGARAALATAARLIGLSDDPGALVPRHRVVGELQRRFPGLRLGRGRSMLEVLLPIVLAQRVTHEEARATYARLVDALGEAAPGPCPGLRLPPTPQALRSLPAHAMRRLGIGERTAHLVRELACRAGALERLSALEPPAAYEQLRTIAGIGPWTAAIATARGLGWADAVPWGDCHLPSAVSWGLAREPRGDDERMRELLEPYSGQRWRVVQLLTAADLRAPRRGPRTPRSRGQIS